METYDNYYILGITETDGNMNYLDALICADYKDAKFMLENLDAHFSNLVAGEIYGYNDGDEDEDNLIEYKTFNKGE